MDTGRTYWIGYTERARPAGADLCERSAHSVEAKLVDPLAEKMPSSTRLAPGPVESWSEVAVLPSGARATAASCAVVQGFIRRRPGPERNVAAYRVLVAAMAAARSKAELPFRLTRKSERPAACTDARSALAKLPMGALLDISSRCLDSERYRDGSSLRCPVLKPNASSRAEVSFGMSPPDGYSWRVGFVHRDGWPEEITLYRTLVIYH